VAQLLIGKVAKRVGVKPDTIRFYERAGMLAKPERSPSGYRIYTDADVTQLQFIRKAQALGFSLAEIKRILNLRGRGRETCRCVIAMAEATLAETEVKLRELQRFHAALQQHVKKWKREPQRRVRAEFCALIQNA
jgi:DNA-binding transcriptional MerR regulator